MRPDWNSIHLDDYVLGEYLAPHVRTAQNNGKMYAIKCSDTDAYTPSRLHLRTEAAMINNIHFKYRQLLGATHKTNAPNIITVHDMHEGVLSESTGYVCLITPYIPDSTQEFFLQPIEKKLELLMHLSDALSLVHHANMRYEDLKPEHVRIYGESPRQFVLVDFGEAHSRSDAHYAAHPRGSLEFMSPQQFDGVVDSRVDSFQLGLYSFYLLSNGAHAFFIPPEDVHQNIRMGVAMQNVMQRNIRFNLLPQSLQQNTDFCDGLRTVLDPESTARPELFACKEWLWQALPPSQRTKYAALKTFPVKA